MYATTPAISLFASYASGASTLGIALLLSYVSGASYYHQRRTALSKRTGTRLRSAYSHWAFVNKPTIKGVHRLEKLW